MHCVTEPRPARALLSATLLLSGGRLFLFLLCRMSVRTAKSGSAMAVAVPVRLLPEDKNLLKIGRLSGVDGRVIVQDD